MVEALVQYIEAQGFAVDVGPGMLIISKQVEGIGYATKGWSISQAQIAQAHKETLFEEADWYMLKIDYQLKLAKQAATEERA